MMMMLKEMILALQWLTVQLESTGPSLLLTEPELHAGPNFVTRPDTEKPERDPTRKPCSNAAKTRSPLKFAGVPKLTKRSQPL